MAKTFTEDANLTAKENFEIFKTGQAESDYVLGDYTGTVQGDQDLYTELKIKVSKEEKEIEDFYAARETARSDFNALWQAKEDNGYDVDYTP